MQTCYWKYFSHEVGVIRRKEDERLGALGGSSSAAPKLLFARAKEHVVNAIDVVAARIRRLSAAREPWTLGPRVY